MKSLSKHLNLFEMQLSEDFMELSPMKLKEKQSFIIHDEKPKEEEDTHIYEQRPRLSSIQEVDEKKPSFNDLSEDFFTEKVGDLTSTA